MSTIDENIQEVGRLLHEPGSAFEFGCLDTDSEKFIQLAIERYPGKPYCLVRDWVVWDVGVNDAELKQFEADSIKPIFLHAKFVINDQTGRARYGYYRISTPLVEISEPCFFVTRNTVYILAGSGTRKEVDVKEVNALFLKNN